MWLGFLRAQPHLTTSWSRSHCWHFRFSSYDLRSLNMLSNCYRGWCGCSRVYLGLDNRRNHQFGSLIPHISLTKVVGCIPPSRLGQFIKSHLLLPKALHAVLYRFSHCAHHPARFIIITEFAELCIFFIFFLVCSILLIIGTCKIAQTVSDSIQHLFKRSFGLSGCGAFVFSSCHISHKRCLCVLNSLSCHSGLSLHKILDPFLFLFIAYKVRFLSFLRRKLLLDRKLRNAPNARTQSATKPLLPSFAWWRRRVECFVDLPYLPAGSAEKFFLGALTIVSCVDLVVGRDVGCCKIWTTWRQAESFMSRFVCLINSNKAKSACWPSFQLE